MFLRLATVLLLVTLPELRAQEMTAAWIDVGEIVDVVADSAAGSWSLPIWGAYGSMGGATPPYFGENDGEPRVSIDRLVDMIRQSVDRESWDMEGRSIRVTSSGRHLMVQQSPAVIEKIRRFIAQATAVICQRYRVEVQVLRASPAGLAGLTGAGAILPAARLESIRSQGEAGVGVVLTQCTTLRAGKRTRLRAGLRHSIVGAADVEVAQTASIGDPRILQILEGLDAWVRVNPLIDGRASLRFMGGFDQDFDVSEVRSPAIGVLQLPQLATSRVSATANLSRGDAVVVGMIDARREDSSVLLVRVDWDEETEPRRVDDDFMRPYPVAALTASYLQLPEPSRGAGLGDRSIGDDGDGGFGEAEGERRFMEIDEILDAFRRVVTPRSVDEDRYSLDAAGGWVWVQGSVEQQRATAKVLKDLTAVRARTVSIEVVVVTLTREALEAARSANRGSDMARAILRSPAPRRFHGMTVSELDGSAQLVAGREFAFLRDFDVEIAQGSTIAGPRVETAFDGFSIRLQPRLGTDKNYVLGWRLSLSQVPAPSTWQSSLGVGGAVQLVSPRVADSEGSTLVAPNELFILTELPSTDRPGDVDVVLGRLR